MAVSAKMDRFPKDMTKNFTVFRNGKELEVCVICGAVTDVEYSTPISLRSGYVVGVGQLCKNCSAY